jgi:zinc protease
MKGRAWIQLPPMAREVLPNGLTLLVIENRSLPLVTIRLMMRAGCSQDPRALSGLAAFTARLLKHGAGSRDARQQANDLDFIGGHIGASVGLDQMGLDGEFTTATWDEGLALFLDALFLPRFDEAEIERERARGIAEIAQGKDDPDHVADRAFQYYVFGEGAHPYAHPPEGTVASMSALSREDLVRFHRECMVPDGAVLVVIGDVETASTAQRLAGALSSWRARGSVPSPPSDAPRLSGRRCVLVHDAGSGQAQYRVGNVGLKRMTPHYHALLVANTVFGGGFTSRLVNEVRVNRGLTYGIGARFLLPMSPGPFLISSFTRNAKLAEMHEVVGQLLATLRKDGTSEDEVEAAKAYLLGLQVRRLELLEALAGAISETEMFGLGVASITDFREHVEAVDVAACARAIHAAYPGDDLLTVLVGDRAEIAETASGFGALSVIDADFAEGMATS